jgi:hypothetical protein
MHGVFSFETNRIQSITRGYIKPNSIILNNSRIVTVLSVKTH